MERMEYSCTELGRETHFRVEILGRKRRNDDTMENERAGVSE
jgi:hypothetical protein